jgi:hypothetical protein
LNRFLNCMVIGLQKKTADLSVTKGMDKGCLGWGMGLHEKSIS